MGVLAPNNFFDDNFDGLPEFIKIQGSSTQGINSMVLFCLILCTHWALRKAVSLRYIWMRSIMLYMQ